jgi:ribosome-associated protein
MTSNDPFSEQDNQFDDDEDIKSRSQVKREMEALQQVGKQLCELKASQLKDVPISEDLAHGIETYHRISSREAKRRQLQYIGKLMRTEDMEGIQEVLDRYDTSSNVYAQRLHQLEAWRARLIQEGNDVVTEFIEKHPMVNVQTLRQLVRQAKKDVSNDKNTGAAKKLFKFIKEYEADILN